MMFANFIALSAILIAINAHPMVIENQNQSNPDWWKNTLFYQVYPQSFKDSKGTGTGDIKGITEKLGYFKELGIDALKLGSFLKSPMKDFGYDVSNFYEVDPIFGTMEDLEVLLEKAKEKDLKIVMDFVPNHSSEECEWFKKSVKKEAGFEDFYIWHDGKKDSNGNLVKGADGIPLPPNNWQSHYYGFAWTWNEERKQYYYHAFDVTEPHFNYHSTKVFVEMKKVMEFWLSKGFAGIYVNAVNSLYKDEQFRDEPLSQKTDDPKSYDYTEHIYTENLPETFEMVYKFREIVDQFYEQHGGWFKPILMTEAYAKKNDYVKYFGSEDGKKVGSQIPFNFVMLDNLNEKSTANDFKQVIDGHVSFIDNKTRLNWVIGNHDHSRVASRFGPEKADALLTFAMTLPGVAVTYQGEEIGMFDNRNGISFEETKDPKAISVGKSGPWKEVSRDPARTPFQWNSGKFAGFMPAGANAKPWLPIHPNHVNINVEVEQNTLHSTLKYYKKLAQLRKQPAFSRLYGSKVFNDNVFGYFRTHCCSKITYVVLFNFGEKEEHVNVTELTPNLGETCEVAVAGPHSQFSEGQQFKTEDVVMKKYDIVILKAAPKED